MILSSALELLLVGIEKRIGFPINSYTMTYRADPAGLFFTVGDQTREETGATATSIIFIIKNLCKEKLKPGETIDCFKLVYTKAVVNKLGEIDNSQPATAIVDLFVTKPDGSKEKLTHDILKTA